MPQNSSQVGLGALSTLSYGLYVVSSCFDNRSNAQISNTVFQLTARPPRIAVSINRTGLTHEYVSKSGLFAVSVLDESTPMEFITLLGFKSGRKVDKLSQVASKQGVTGCPIVTENALSALEAKVVQRVELGTHTVFVGEVVSGEVFSHGTPLTYAFYREHKKGKTPKRAPTYMGVQDSRHVPTQGSNRMNKYVCTVCGYVYDPALGDPDNGVEPQTAFEDLPDDWVCPQCGADKDQFEEEN